MEKTPSVIASLPLLCMLGLSAFALGVGIPLHNYRLKMERLREQGLKFQPDILEKIANFIHRPLAMLPLRRKKR